MKTTLCPKCGHSIRRFTVAKKARVAPQSLVEMLRLFVGLHAFLRDFNVHDALAAIVAAEPKILDEVKKYRDEFKRDKGGG